MSNATKKLSVEKVGGTSISNTEVVLKNVLLRPEDRGGTYNRIIVVSAYSGITNKLLEHKKSGEPGVYALFTSAESDGAWNDTLTEVGQRMTQINQDIFGDHSDCQIADNFVRERIEGVRSCLFDLHRLCTYGHFRLDQHLSTVREMLSALGEAHSAHNTALLLRQRDVNAKFVDLTGWRDETQLSLNDRIHAAFEQIDTATELPIVTGYALCKEGLMNSYDRGYTEVTFSRIAVLMNADEAVIYKEFHLSSADPKIVGLDKVRTIGRTNYDVADQLSNMGMEAIHPRAAQGLRQAGIPLKIKNTFDPNDLGTEFRGDYISHQPCTEIITGLKNIIGMEFFEQDMVGVKGYDAAILDALKRHRVRIVSKSSNANTIMHYLEGSLKAVRRVVADLESGFPSANIAIRKVAIVSAIGSDLNVAGLTADAARALNDAGVEILGLHQLIRNVDVQFVVEESDFDTALKALHKALVEERKLSTKNKRASLAAA